MYIYWGSGGDRKQLAANADPTLCDRCHTLTPNSYWLEYRYFHFYSVFGVVTRRQYFAVCNRCQTTREVARQDVPAEHLSTNPIPYSHRCGLLIGVGLVTAICVAVALTEDTRQNKKVAQFPPPRAPQPFAPQPFAPPPGPQPAAPPPGRSAARGAGPSRFDRATSRGGRIRADS